MLRNFCYLLENAKTHFTLSRHCDQTIQPKLNYGVSFERWWTYLSFDTYKYDVCSLACPQRGLKSSDPSFYWVFFKWYVHIPLACPWSVTLKTCVSAKSAFQSKTSHFHYKMENNRYDLARKNNLFQAVHSVFHASQQRYPGVSIVGFSTNFKRGEVQESHCSRTRLKTVSSQLQILTHQTSSLAATKGCQLSNAANNLHFI